jgi:hypothetical protein
VLVLVAAIHLVFARRHPPGPFWSTAAAELILVAISSVLSLVAAEALAASAMYCASKICVAAALLLIADVATTAAPAVVEAAVYALKS